jgi:type IV secretory pathway VirB2 component (pilin)
VLAFIAMLVTGTLALEAALARWVPPGSAPAGGIAMWAALVACAWVCAAVAHKNGRGRLRGPLVFILLIILLFYGTFFLECLVGPTGCEV